MSDDEQLGKIVRELSEARAKEKQLDKRIKEKSKVLGDFSKYITEVFTGDNMAFYVQLSRIEVTSAAIRYKDGYLTRDTLDELAREIDEFKSARHTIDRLEKELKKSGVGDVRAV